MKLCCCIIASCGKGKTIWKTMLLYLQYRTDKGKQLLKPCCYEYELHLTNIGTTKTVLFSNSDRAVYGRLNAAKSIHCKNNPLLKIIVTI